MGKKKVELMGVSCNAAHANISLEIYARIYDELCHKNPQPPPSKPRINRLLTKYNISQVLKMHGFSTSKLTREAMLEGLEDMEMFNPHRSSVDIGDFESDLTTEETERDLETLGWVDCPSKSVDGFMPFPQSLMSAPSPVFTRIPESGKKSSLTTIHANEACEQPVPLQSTTTASIQHLSKSGRQTINSDASDEERSGVATSSSMS